MPKLTELQNGHEMVKGRREKVIQQVLHIGYIIFLCQGISEFAAQETDLHLHTKVTRGIMRSTNTPSERPWASNSLVWQNSARYSIAVSLEYL